MKKATSIISFIGVLISFSCSTKQHPIDLDSSGNDGTGVLQVSVHMEKVGVLNKIKRTTVIDLTKLYITLSADGQNTLYDTFQLSGGNEELLERKTYPGMVAFVNGEFVEWTLSVEARDREDQVIHSGDTTFTVIPRDTVTIPLQLSAQYSMLVANFFPIRDSVTRCELGVDSDTVADTSFAKQSLVGDTVILSFDYLTATPTGVSHHIDLNVYGNFEGEEKLFYTGDITILVNSGVDTNYNIILSYVGPVPVHGSSVMVVTLGKVGKMVIDGKLFAFDRYLLTTTNGGNGTVSGSDSVTQGIPYPITAIPSKGYYFKGWQVTRGTAAIADSFTASTTVILEDGNATVEGIFGKELITFQKTFGGVGEEQGASVQQTSDGGYIISGMTSSFGSEWYDSYLIKTDKYGDTLWTKTLGTGYGFSVQQTIDGGYILSGLDHLIKTNSDGDMVWTKGFEGQIYSVKQTSDRGYILAGRIDTSIIDWTGNSHFIWNALLIKTDVNGDAIWKRTFKGGGNLEYETFSVLQTSDGGYILHGDADSIIDWYQLNQAWNAMLLIRTNEYGDTIWTRIFKDATSSMGNTVQQTSDGGFVLIGSNLIKTDSNGNTIWKRRLNFDLGYSVQQTFDGDYITVGDYLTLIKTDADGNTIWIKTFGNTFPTWGISLQQTNDEGYIIACETVSLGAGQGDIILIKTDENGNVKTVP